MRRADRLFQIVQLIRGRRLTTAKWLALRLEISERTVYRDVADLQNQGVPIEGEAGVGYRLGAGFDLPPLIFTAEEAQALVVMTRVAQQWLDPALARASETAMSRVLSVLPADQRYCAQNTAVFSPLWGLTAKQQPCLQLWRESTHASRKLALSYRDAAGQISQRTVWPLGSFFWGAVWTLVAWCEQRQDFRSFRLDRIQHVTPQGEIFKAGAGQRLIDYLRRQGVDPQELTEGKTMSKEHTMKLVEYSELTVRGLAVRTSNASELEPASALIGNLWKSFGEKIAPLMKPDAYTYGIYHNYESDADGKFDVLVGTDSILSADADALGWRSANIACGLYLVFEVKGAVPQAVIEAWQFIWQYFADAQCPYKRTFSTDFERYRSKGLVDICVAVIRS